MEKLVLLTLMSVISLSDKSSRIFNFNFTGACEQIIKDFQSASKHTYRKAIWQTNQFWLNYRKRVQTLPTLWWSFSKPHRCMAVFVSLHRTTPRIKFRASLISFRFQHNSDLVSGMPNAGCTAYRTYWLQRISFHVLMNLEIVVKSDNVKICTRCWFLSAWESVWKWTLSFKTYQFTAGFDPVFQDLLLKMKSREHNKVLVDSLYGAILSGLRRGGSRNCSAIYRIHSQHPIQTAPLNVYLLIRALFCQQETVLNCQF